jgi:hypothetical protein
MHYSVKNLKGYAIGATDGDIGKVDDFYFDDDFWTIRYLVAETGSWLLDRKVLISPFALGEVDVSRERLNVTLTKKQAPASILTSLFPDSTRNYTSTTTVTHLIGVVLFCGDPCAILGSQRPI